MTRAGTVTGKTKRFPTLLHLSSAAGTYLFVLGIVAALLVVSVSLGNLSGASERIRFDRVLESRVIDGLQAESANYVGETIVIQGSVKSIEHGRDIGGTLMDVLVVGGLEEGHTPIRIFVTGGTAAGSTSSVIYATGTGMQDLLDPQRLALQVEEINVLPIATFNVNEIAISVLAFASLFGALMAALGVFWERHAAALTPQNREGGTSDSSVQSPPFLRALARGKDPLSVRLRMAFLAALGRALFVFGLIAFLYVYITVYVFAAASVDWWVHHWVPWLRLDVFAALGLLAAFIGFFLYTFVQQLTRRP